MAVQVHELYGHLEEEEEEEEGEGGGGGVGNVADWAGQGSYLFEGSLGEEMSLDPGQGLVRVVIGLFYQTQLLSLALVQTALHTVGLLQSLQS